jgi:hypothetical protein
MRTFGPEHHGFFLWSLCDELGADRLNPEECWTGVLYCDGSYRRVEWCGSPECEPSGRAREALRREYARAVGHKPPLFDDG